MPVTGARDRLVHTTRYCAMHQGVRAQIPQDQLARNKRRSERSSRCAARAALDLEPHENPPPGTHSLKCPTMPLRSLPSCANSTLERALSCIASASWSALPRISYVCFGPVMPVTGARDRLVHTTRYCAMHQGVRAQIPQDQLARNKRRSERSSRCAARAALDLEPHENPPPGTHSLKCPTMPLRSLPSCANSTLERALSCIASAAWSALPRICVTLRLISSATELCCSAAAAICWFIC